jgi:transcriptional regulator with XRE-family HTH domain
VAEDEWLYAEIGRRIRDARRRAGLTQAALGTLVGLSRTSVTNIESGNQQPTIHALWRIAGAVDAPACSLLPEGPPADRTATYLPTDVPAATRAVLLKLARSEPEDNLGKSRH